MPRAPRLLPSEFFARPVLEVAPDLLGKYLVRRHPDGSIAAHMITEVEAYDGEEDKACHASKGRTKRTETLYGPPGNFYVYLCYGVHWLLNLVADREGYPAGVLIRGVAGALGPGRVTKLFGIDGSLNGKPALREAGIWIEDRGVAVHPDAIMKTPRIGVAYAGEWALKPYRFVFDQP